MHGVKAKGKTPDKKPSKTKKCLSGPPASLKKSASHKKGILPPVKKISSSRAEVPWHDQSTVNNGPSFVPQPPRSTNLQATLPNPAPVGQQLSVRPGPYVMQPPMYSPPEPDRVLLQRRGESLDDIAQEALTRLISSRFDSIINSIDEETFRGDEKDLGTHAPLIQQSLDHH